MAAPRMFVSSTFYDLRYVRSDLQQFERETGFQLVQFERADIPYQGTQRLEESCRDEIEKCDIVVSIIGGRYGSASSRDPSISISRSEVEHAVQIGRQLFVFVERGVHSEYQTYLENINEAYSDSIKWRSVDSVSVFEFIHHIQQLPANNAMFAFDTSKDLMSQLRSQLSGLFQTMLHQQRRGRIDANANKLVEAVATLDRVVDYLRRQQDNEKRAMNDILFSRHPAFLELREALNLRIRLIFEDFDELAAIFDLVGYHKVAEKELTDEDCSKFFFWSGKGRRVGVSRRLFGDEPGCKLVTLAENDRPPEGFVVIR